MSVMLSRDFELKSLTVLYLDCQTTGAVPGKSEVLEIGWKQSHIPSEPYKDSQRVYSHVLKLQTGSSIPARVQKVTGILPEDINSGIEAEEAWMKLLGHAESVKRINLLDWCPLVIHYARFEEAFLADLHKRYSGETAYPFRLICTHSISRRLFPELPRRSLRAVSGYLGYSVGELRRCADHIDATEFVWKSMLMILRKHYRITTYHQLLEWLKKPLMAVSKKKRYPMDQGLISGLPDKPGIYRMLRSNGDILYIGKAGSLKNRVKSYFHKSRRHPEHILEMLSQARQVDIQATDSAMEAAIKESDEIKRFSPPYNIALRGKKKSLFYCSRDFSLIAGEASEECMLGPFLSKEPVEALCAMKELLRQEGSMASQEEILMKAIAIPCEKAPEQDCLNEGLDIFMDYHGYELNCGSVIPALRNISRKVWQRRKAEREAEKPDEAHENEDHEWNPEAVCRLLESNIMWGFHEIRRACWTVILSESSLAWQEDLSRGPSRFLIVFERGRILRRESPDSGDIPAPPGYKRSRADRFASLNVATIDRMRVVTAEMRKLVNRKRWIKLCLGPGTFLERDRLEKLFEWV